MFCADCLKHVVNTHVGSARSKHISLHCPGVQTRLSLEHIRIPLILHPLTLLLTLFQSEVVRFVPTRVVVGLVVFLLLWRRVVRLHDLAQRSGTQDGQIIALIPHVPALR